MVFGADENRVLDAIIAQRRSIRRFKENSPSKEQIEQIIQAGIRAPYAGLHGRRLSEIRRFAVFTRGTEPMARVEQIMRSEMGRGARKLGILSKIVPYLRRNARPFVKTVAAMAASGIPAFRTAPFYIVVGERKGFPPVEKQSIAYVLENMWLKATALGLGFQLVSATQTMAGNREFMRLAGIPYGEFSIDGCVIGYPGEEPAPRGEIAVEELARWI